MSSFMVVSSSNIENKNLLNILCLQTKIFNSKLKTLNDKMLNKNKFSFSVRGPNNMNNVGYSDWHDCIIIVMKCHA